MAEKKKNQLHQLLAIETDLKNKAKIIAEETISTFHTKSDHFDGVQKVFVKSLDDAQDIPPERKEIVTTVAKKIDYAKSDIIKSIDAMVSKEETNNSGEATAELEFDGKVHTLSATSLLALTNQLVLIRAVYKSIPTLDPTKKWNKDDKAGKDIYETEPEVKFRTEKKQKPIVLYPATEKHPAQTQLAYEDVQVGKYETTYSSGRITPGQKADLINRVEELIVKVKKARAKANQVEIKNTKIGKDIFDYINRGIL